MILLFVIFFPMLWACVSFSIGRKDKALRDSIVIFGCLIELGICALLFMLALAGRKVEATLPLLCNMGLHFRMDGFRAMYLLIGAFMWAMTSMLSREYFSNHYHNRNRYYFFFLFTLGATLGVFLSRDLFTTFIFFEIMSFTSYTWVAHDETPGALRAAETYLAVAVIGGMVMLVGLMLLWQALGTLELDLLYERAKAYSGSLWVPGICILLGFGAKAGMFPLHIWLPKAHPVAPAPASALLSGILTKTGIYGVIAITLEVFRDSFAWGNLILSLGMITMLLGAILGVFSINLKRTLACSSMSQIGFILTGVACSQLLGAHNALAARGTVLYMLNHSLFKLILFMAAGVIYMNLHKLDLNDVRGFGRNKPVLHLCFLMGMFGLMGIPFFSGYVSKTLIHEGLVELSELMAEEGHAYYAILYTIGEWVFLFSGGLTGAYMLKLYICIFWEKHPYYQLAYDEVQPYMNPLSALALLLSAALVPLLGVRPALLMDPLADMAAGIVHQGHLAHAVDYFSLTNLKGALISISIGLVVYLAVIRPLLLVKRDGEKVYINAWPQGLDLEEKVYRPLIMGMLSLGGKCACIADERLIEKYVYAPIIRKVTQVGSALADLGSERILEKRVFEPLLSIVTGIGSALANVCSEKTLENGVYKPVIAGLSAVGFFVSKAVGQAADAVAAGLSLTVLRAAEPKKVHHHAGNAVTAAVGSAMDEAAETLNHTVWRSRPKEHQFVGRLMGLWEGARDARQRMTHTMSYALLMFALGLAFTLIYLLFFQG